MKPTLTVSLIAASLIALPGAVQAATATEDPPSVYCEQMSTAIEKRVTEDMQIRMPERMPGEYMDKVHNVGDIVDMTVDFGMPSISGIFSWMQQWLGDGALYVKGLFLEYANKELTKQLNVVKNNIHGELNEAGVTGGVNQAEDYYRLYEKAERNYQREVEKQKAMQSQSALEGKSLYQTSSSTGSGPTLTESVGNFFSNLFK